MQSFKSKHCDISKTKKNSKHINSYFADIVKLTIVTHEKLPVLSQSRGSAYQLQGMYLFVWKPLSHLTQMNQVQLALCMLFECFVIVIVHLGK